jgi:phospholipase C
MSLDRRQFVTSALALSGAALVGGKFGTPAAAGALPEHRRSRRRLPDPERSGVEHVVVVMMENRSFDHLLGWLPGADGRQAGLSYRTPDGARHKTHHLRQLNGCGFADPDHSYAGGRIQYAGGRMDGFLLDTNSDSFAISYYRATDRPFMSSLARRYVTCDRYFCSILGPTFPNRFFQHAAQTDRLSNTLSIATLPTIWDRLNLPGGPTGRYYFSDLPVVALWGAKYQSIASPLAQFISDAAAGTLPEVSFVDPSFLGEDNATSNDDHPLADLRAGDAFLSQIFHALASGPGWSKTVLVINYDEWGGFFEHVPPSRVTAGVPIGVDPHDGVDRDLDDKGRVLTGFRVPCIVASPFTRHAASVSHHLFDHTSVLKLIEWRWGLAPLSQRDASDGPADPRNLAYALDFSRPDTSVPKQIPVLPPFAPTACPPPSAPAAAPSARASVGRTPTELDVATREDWIALRRLATAHGW